MSLEIKGTFYNKMINPPGSHKTVNIYSLNKRVPKYIKQRLKN